MVRLECQSCGAGLHWDGSSETVRCSYCGAEYLMHPQTERFTRGYVDPFTGTGEVQAIPMQTNSEFPGMYPTKSYVPKGWRVRSRQADPEYYGDHAGNPFVFETEYRSPDNSVFVLLRGGNMYTDRKLSRVPLFHQIDVLGSYLRIGSPFSAEQYCDYIMQRDICPASARKIRVSEAGEKELAKQRKIYSDYMSNGFISLNCEWKRVFYEVNDNTGKRLIVSVETRLCDGYKPSQQPMMGGGMFGMFFGGMANNAQHYWETQYEMLVVAGPDSFDSALRTAEKIFATADVTEDRELIRMQFMQKLQGLQMDTAASIAKADMDSFHRQQGIISSTHSSIMNTIHETNAATSATHQKVANMHSESLRGKNVYETARPGGGVPEHVEADVKWDHVFQNTEQTDIFAASENYWLEPGVDFEELRRSDGNY